MACKCINGLNKKLAAHNTALDQISLIDLKTGKVREAIHVATRKVDTKQRGKAKLLLTTYCPFCGKRSAPKPKAA